MQWGQNFEKKYLKNEEKLNRWTRRVVENFNRKYNQQETRLPTDSMSDKTLQELRRMQEIFVISPCDKLSHNFGITCKHLYMKDLRNEILSNETYHKVTPQDIAEWNIGGVGVEPEHETFVYRSCLRRQKQFNEDHNLQHKDNLFYLYGLPKMHKKKTRYIAGVGKSFLPTEHGGNLNQDIGNGLQQLGNGNGAVVEEEEEELGEDDFDEEETVELVNGRIQRDRVVLERRHSARQHKPQCSTTAASKSLSKQLNFVIDLLREKDKANEQYKRCFITRKADEVFEMIKRNQVEFDGMIPRTYDFTTLYTKLPLEQIVENMEVAINEAMDFKQMQEQHGMNNMEFLSNFVELKSRETILEYVNFIIHNTFIANSVSEVYHQRVGIPMGTNCAPEIATLVLYVWESRYIDHLVASNRMEEAILHKHTKRFIDDIICFNTVAFPMAAYGNLEYTEQPFDHGVTFLGAKFQNIRQRFRISVFDKAKEWPLHVIRYPAAQSNTPQHQGKGIYIGELRRYQLMVNSLSAFKEVATMLTRNMYMRGYYEI